MFRVPVLRGVLASRQLDVVCDVYIARTDDLARNRQLQQLFLHIVHCARADAYELYMEILRGATMAAKALECPEPRAFSSLTEQIALYHTAAFALENESGFSEVEFIHAAKRVFALDAAAEDALHYYMELGRENVSAFRAAYAQDFAGKLLYGQKPTPVILAFVCGFFDRSYEGFAQSLSKYVPFGGGGNGGKIHRRSAACD